MPFASLAFLRAHGPVVLRGLVPASQRARTVTVILVLGSRRLWTEPAADGSYAFTFSSRRRILWCHILLADAFGRTRTLRRVLIHNPPAPNTRSTIAPASAETHPWFDAAWYLAQNPSVADDGSDPLQHYLREGWKKDRHPHPGFDQTRYLAHNLQLLLDGTDPLTHWNLRRDHSAIPPPRPRITPPDAGSSEFSRARPYPFASPAAMRATRDAYIHLRRPRNRVAFCTVIIGDYDTLRLPEHLSPGIDYFALSDRATDGYGVFKLIPPPADFTKSDPTRLARRLKLHLHRLIPDYDIVIFADANVLVRGDFTSWIDAFRASAKPLAFVPHPARDCLYEEAVAIAAAGRDTPPRFVPQLLRYQREGFPYCAGLIEANLFAIRPGHPDTRAFFDAWWHELQNGSHRDQLSANYVLWKLGLSDYHPLLGPARNTRNHPDIALLPHGTHDAPAFAALIKT